MNVNRALRRNGEYRGREHLTVRRHDEEVRVQGLQVGDGLIGFDRVGLENGHTAFDGGDLERVDVLMVTASRAIRLSHQTDDLMRRIEQREKRGLRQIPGPHEDDAKTHDRYS